MLIHGHCRGDYRSPEYHSWNAMIQRCYNPRHHNYPNYGGRGIGVCARWRKYVNFYADMGDRPRGTTLDRLKVNKNYCKQNCRWADIYTQRANQRRCFRVTHAGG